LLHFSGRLADARAILPSGPLNWGQWPDFEHDVTAKVIAIRGMASDINIGLGLIKIYNY
jgi:hypothetical protein